MIDFPKHKTKFKDITYQVECFSLKHLITFLTEKVEELETLGADLDTAKIFIDTYKVHPTDPDDYDVSLRYNVPLTEEDLKEYERWIMNFRKTLNDQKPTI